LQHRKRWLTFLGVMGQENSVRKSALACGVSASTFARWRRRVRDCGPGERLKILGALLGAGLTDIDALSELSLYNELLPLILSLLS